MIHDLSSTVLEAKTGDYSVTRSARNAPVKGRAVASTTSTLTIAASVTPVTGEELAQLPELQVTTEVRRVITPTRVYAMSATYDPDVLTIDGDTWEVSKVEDWSSLGGFFVAYVTKKGRT